MLGEILEIFFVYFGMIIDCTYRFKQALTRPGRKLNYYRTIEYLPDSEVSEEITTQVPILQNVFV